MQVIKTGSVLRFERTEGIKTYTVVAVILKEAISLVGYTNGKLDATSSMPRDEFSGMWAAVMNLGFQEV